MSQLKLNEPFYPYTLTLFEILKQADLTAAEWRIWSFLSINETWGVHYKDTDALKIMSACEVSQATYFRAIAKFKEFNLFEIQDKGISYKNNYGTAQLRQLKNDNATLKNDNATLKNDNATLKNDNGFSRMIMDSHSCESQKLETAPDMAFGSPKIYKIDQINKTLSDPEEENGQLTAESTPPHEGNLTVESTEKKAAQKIGSDSEERERFSNSESKESKSNGSSPPLKKPRSKPSKIKPSSVGKGFAPPCSTNKLQKDSFSAEFTQLIDLYGLPRTVKALKDVKGFPFDQYEGFLKYVRECIDLLPSRPGNLDAYVLKHLDSYTSDYLYELNKKRRRKDAQAESQKAVNQMVLEQEKRLELFRAAYQHHLKDEGLEDSPPVKARFKVKFMQEARNGRS